jgi:hypothetical protein
MNKGKWILLLFLLAGAPILAQSNDEAACEKVKQQIRDIESKMRSGYSAAQGIRYDEKLRQLKGKRSKLCR